ncbi:MAG: hypothetical protein L0H63_05140 [Nitrococcus sp.]|nr:hypothetical protein [Nitrococcus sp.]
MDEEFVLRTLAALPPDHNELYFHPGTCSGAEIAATMHGYQHQRELGALLSRRVAATLTDIGITRIGVRDSG